MSPRDQGGVELTEVWINDTSMWTGSIEFDNDGGTISGGEHEAAILSTGVVSGLSCTGQGVIENNENVSINWGGNFNTNIGAFCIWTNTCDLGISEIRWRIEYDDGGYSILQSNPLKINN